MDASLKPRQSNPPVGTRHGRHASPRRRPLTALVIAVAAAAVLAPTAAAQFAPLGETSITVTGTGEASAPAEIARLQFLVARADPFAGEFGGVSVDEEAVAAAEEGAAEDDAADADAGATPEAETETDDRLGAAEAGESVDLPFETVAPRPVTEEDLEPMLAAIVDAGVARDEIDVDAGPVASNLFGPSGAVVELTIEQPEAAQVEEIVTAAVDAATEAGLFVEHAGVEYDVADCSALVREARQAAIDDARVQAEQFADLLGVTLGDVLQLSDYGFFGPIPPGEEGCPPSSSGVSYGGPFEAINTAPFDADAPAEAEVYAQLNLSFAYEPAGS